MNKCLLPSRASLDHFGKKAGGRTDKMACPSRTRTDAGSPGCLDKNFSSICRSGQGHLSGENFLRWMGPHEVCVPSQTFKSGWIHHVVMSDKNGRFWYQTLVICRWLSSLSGMLAPIRLGVPMNFKLNRILSERYALQIGQVHYKPIEKSTPLATVNI